MFVAGSTGAVGKFLVPHLVENEHEVAALARAAEKAKAQEAMGAKVVLADALNKEELTAAIRRGEPEVIIHQLTALVLEAKDLNHAIQLMSKHPGVRRGPFEIRPAEDLTEMIRESERRRATTNR